jgi:hypothetical protein
MSEEPKDKQEIISNNEMLYLTKEKRYFNI